MLNDSKFWSLVAGLLFYAVKVFNPDFPLDEGAVLKVILFVLGLFGVAVPVLRSRGSLK